MGQKSGVASVQQVCEAERERDGEIESTPHTFRGMSRLKTAVCLSCGDSSGFYLAPQLTLRESVRS